MKKKGVKLSKSICVKVNQHGKEYSEAYILMRILHAYYKHPIIFNFKANITPLRLLIGYSDKKFRQTINEAIRIRMARMEGNNLIFWSNNADRDFKPTKGNDYTTTKTPHKTFEEILIKNFYYRQKAKLKAKQNQTSYSSTSGDFEYLKQVAPQTRQFINQDITLSSRAMAKLLNGNSPAFGAYKKKQHQETGFINLYPNKVALPKDHALHLIKTGHHNIRFDKEQNLWFYVLADIFELGNKRKRFSYCKKGTLYTDI